MTGSTIIQASSPPSGSYPLQVGSYLVTASLTLCVWDWIISISDEHRMIRCGQEHRYFINGLYFVVRICSIVYLVICLLCGVNPVVNPTALVLALSIINMIIQSASSALFFMHLRAIYFYNKYVMGFFALCWLVVLVFFVLDGTMGIVQCVQSHPSSQCLTIRRVTGLSYLAAAVYHTLMYLVISWQLASSASSESWKDHLRSFVTGNGLLQSGQLYHFVMISFATWTIVFIYGLPESSPWKGVAMPPNAAIACLMSCRLFRELKLGHLASPGSEGELPTTMCRIIPTSQTDPELELGALGGPAGGGTGIVRHDSSLDGNESGKGVCDRSITSRLPNHSSADLVADISVCGTDAC